MVPMNITVVLVNKSKGVSLRHLNHCILTKLYNLFVFQDIGSVITKAKEVCTCFTYIAYHA